MSAQLEIIAEVRRWVEKAENDFRNAEYVLTLKENCLFDTVSYHCRQCAEKYLKAALVHRNMEFPRTHDMVVLFNIIQKTAPLHLRVEDIQPLNRYAIEAGYPGDWEPIDESEVRNAFEMAIRLRDVMKEELADVLFEKEQE